MWACGTGIAPVLAADEVRRGHRIAVRPDTVFPLTLCALDLPRSALLEDAHDCFLADSGFVGVDRHQHFRGPQVFVSRLRLVIRFLEAPDEGAGVGAGAHARLPSPPAEVW